MSLPGGLPCSIGVDLSTTATGVVVLHGIGGKRPHLVLEEEIKFPKLHGMSQKREIITRVMTIIEETQPERIVVEGYSLNMKNASSVIPLVELGGLFRFCLQVDGKKWLAPTAGELKLAVSGKGNTPKDKLMMYVLKHWGHESLSNNTADAYGCACIGLAHMGRLPGALQSMLLVSGALKLLDN